MQGPFNCVLIVVHIMLLYDWDKYWKHLLRKIILREKYATIYIYIYRVTAVLSQAAGASTSNHLWMAQSIHI